jgi:hypothetical protein
MANLTDTPEFTANEVYQIASTDPVEGAASGASFSGNGVSNQPHQQLANRTAFLKQRQDTNIANIATLLAFMAKFVGSMGPSGYLEIPFLDVNRGAITAVIQWGFQAFAFASGDVNVQVTWPIAFPNACFWAGATPQGDDFSAGIRSASAPNFTKLVGNFVMGWTGDNDDPDPRGFYWLAIGF